MCHKKHSEINFSVYFSPFPLPVCSIACWNWTEIELQKTKFSSFKFFGRTWIEYEIVSTRTITIHRSCSLKLLPPKHASWNICTWQSILEFYGPSVQWCTVYRSEMEMWTQCHLSHNRLQSDHWTKRTQYYEAPIQLILYRRWNEC